MVQRSTSATPPSLNERKIAQWLARISRNEPLTQELVVEKARDPKSPAHKYFEWRDSVAAHRYRLGQAGELIRSVKCEVVFEDRVIVAPAYVHQPGSAPGYSHVEIVKKDDLTARRVMREEISRAIAAVERARSVAAAIGLIQQVDEISTLLRDLRGLAS